MSKFDYPKPHKFVVTPHDLQVNAKNPNIPNFKIHTSVTSTVCKIVDALSGDYEIEVINITFLM